MKDTRVRRIWRAMVADWPTTRLRALAAVTIAATAVISFDSVRHLAESEGFGRLAWFFPVTLDAVAAIGMDIWIRGRKYWGWAAGMAIIMVIASTAANAWDHWQATDHSGIAAGLGAAPPAALAMVLFVLHKHAKGLREARAEVANQDRQPPTAVEQWQTNHHTYRHPSTAELMANTDLTTSVLRSVPASQDRDDKPPTNGNGHHPLPAPPPDESASQPPGPLTDHELEVARDILATDPSIGRSSLAVAMSKRLDTNFGVSRARAALARLRGTDNA